MSAWTPASDMQRARMSLDERTKATALSWPPYRRCRIHWSPSEAKAHPLEVVSRFSIGIILARHWGFSIVSPQLIVAPYW